MRDLGDTWPSGRPRVFSAKLGSVAQHTGRASVARNLREVGGVEVVGQSCSTAEAAAEAFSASGAAFAVVCSSDEVYASMALITVEALRRAGAQRIILAGRSAALAESLEEAGLSDEIYLGCDALALLTSLWVETQGGDDV